MTNVNISVDVGSETKNLSVSIDGQTIPYVDDVSIYGWRNDAGELSGLDVVIRSSNKADNGVVKTITYYVEGSQAAENAIASVQDEKKLHHDIDGFVGVENCNGAVVEDIGKFFSTKR